MIQRLVDALRVLAAPADAQIGAHAAWFTGPHRLAGELADALLLCDSCQQETIGPAQRTRLAEVEEALDAIPPEAWNEDALRADPRWAGARERAADALRALGME